MNDRCNRALFGWPAIHPWTGKPAVPCVGYIESDYDPGTYYPCEMCNPHWQRVKPPTARGTGTR